MSLLRSCLYVIISVIVSLLISELLLQVFWTPPFLDNRYKRDDFSWMRQNVRLNNFGYRDEDTNLLKDKVRIYALGDSFTFGWYIDDWKLAYPQILEEKLVSKYGEKVEVINASQPGFKLKDSLERFRSEGVAFMPDIVILGVNLFDFTSAEFAPKMPKYKFFAKLRLYQLTFGNWERARVTRLTAEELKKAFNQDSTQYKKNVQELKELNELVTSNGGVLILVVFPEYNSFNPNSMYLYNDYHENIKKIVSDASGNNFDITIVDLLEEFEKIKDKRELVLNPTDNHPTILANSIAADQIIKKFNFDTYLPTIKFSNKTPKSKKAVLGDDIGKISEIISIDDRENKWVHFDRAHDLDVQKKVLVNNGERQLSFMRDYLKTVKALIHNGWPGAKIEMHFLGREEIIVSKNVYGYSIAGVTQITAFARENGSAFSKDLDLSNVEITRDQQNINIKIPPDESFDFFRINFDVSVNQIDIEEGRIASFFKTELINYVTKDNGTKIFVPNKLEKYSLPKFVSGDNNYEYVWYGNEQRKAKIVHLSEGFEVKLPFVKENISIEFPLGVELKEKMGPVVNYR